MLAQLYHYLPTMSIGYIENVCFYHWNNSFYTLCYNLYMIPEGMIYGGTALEDKMKRTNYILLAVTILLTGVVVALAAFVSVDNSSDQQKPFTSLYDASDDMLQIIVSVMGDLDPIRIKIHGSFRELFDPVFFDISREQEFLGTVCHHA